jgi:cytochrome c-type biogenesis protein CcmF
VPARSPQAFVNGALCDSLTARGAFPFAAADSMVRTMIAELGHFALILAFAVAILQGTLPMIGAARGWQPGLAVAAPAANLQLLLAGIAFAALTHAFVTSDFSLRIVYENSHTDIPMLYKVTGVWGNHEGSMLLWVFILALFGACATWFGAGLPPRLRARVLAVQGLVGTAFYAFILFTSNPFVRLAEPPMNGRDLNPLLQDPGLAFHPLFLYLGYVGMSMSFSFAVAALIEGRVDAAWARWVRPWTLAAWIFLTCGIAMGSWWAYYELGWGGFWFWDPVENASFMPWLFAAALLHSAIVTERRGSLASWTILLAILAFGFSLIGTFIVRSGVLTSVHAFATDPERGVFILTILAVFVGGNAGTSAEVTPDAVSVRAPKRCAIHVGDEAAQQLTPERYTAKAPKGLSLVCGDTRIEVTEDKIVLQTKGGAKVELQGDKITLKTDGPVNIKGSNVSNNG